MLIDGTGNDQRTANGSFAELLYADGNRARTTAFDSVYAKSSNGGVNSQQVTNPLAFTLVFQRTWV